MAEPKAKAAAAGKAAKAETEETGDAPE